MLRVVVGVGAIAAVVALAIAAAAAANDDGMGVVTLAVVVVVLLVLLVELAVGTQEPAEVAQAILQSYRQQQLQPFAEKFRTGNCRL